MMRIKSCVLFVWLTVTCIMVGCRSQYSTDLPSTSELPTSLIVERTGSPLAVVTASLLPDSNTPVILQAPQTPTAISTVLMSSASPLPTMNEGTFTRQKDSMEMVYIPAGEYLMGTDTEIKDMVKDEKPQHAVYLDAYWIDRTEVTNNMFRQFVQETNYQTEAEKIGTGHIYDVGLDKWNDIAGANWQHPQVSSSSLDGLDYHPVILVSWNDASAYCQWADAQLPTEAQWEKAARGTDGRIFPWGNAIDSARLNFCDQNCPIYWRNKSIDDGWRFTSPVGTYPSGASVYDVLDMAGNVWEWTLDWYDAGYYATSPSQNPQGPLSGVERVVRGGSWFDTAEKIRVTDRFGYKPGDRFDYLGFRCSRSISVVATTKASPPPSPTTGPILIQTETPSPNNLLVQFPIWPGGTLYIWTFEQVYGEIDLTTGDAYTPTDKATGPKDAINLAFSQHSQQIAYLTPVLAPENEPRELWIADVTLKTIRKVWTDKELWLGNIGMFLGLDETQIVWGPNDRYVIITSEHDQAKNHIVVYDVEADQIYNWTGNCKLIARSPNSEVIVPWCILQNNLDKSYAVLDVNGVVQTIEAPQSIIAETLAWCFSSDGKRVLYIGADSQWKIASESGEILNLPLLYQENLAYNSSPAALNLQWSFDNNQVLVYGIEKQAQLCPREKSVETGKTFTRACWFVMDANTGAFTWWPSQEMADASGIPLEFSSFDKNMTFSPDGRWLATTISETRIGHLYEFVVISIEDKQAYSIFVDPFLLPAYYLVWNDK